MVVVLALLYGAALWRPVAPGIWHDDGAYLLLAESLAEGEGLRYGGVSGRPPGAKFPPAYPFVLSTVWRVAPEATARGAAAGVANVVILSLAAGLMWVLARGALGLGPGLAALTLLPWVSADLWRLGMIALSEPLFIGLTLGVLLAAAPVLEDRGGIGRALVAGLLLGLLGLTRTVGVLLLPALLVSVLRGRRWRVAAALAGPSVLFWSVWTVWSSRAAATLPETYRELMGPYGRWSAGQILGNPDGALARAWTETPALTRIASSLLFPGVSALSDPLLFLLGVVGLAAAVYGLRALGPVGVAMLLFVLLYGGVLWMWPHIERRLVTPILPVLVLGLPGIVVGMRELGPRAARVGARVVLVWATLFAIGGVWEVAEERHLDAYAIRETMLARAVAAVDGAVPETAVVGAPELWGGLRLFTGREVAPSARFLPLAETPWGTPDEQFRLWAEAGIDHLVLEQGGRVHTEALDVLDAACPYSVQLLASWQGGLLVRLDWDEDCRERLAG